MKPGTILQAAEKEGRDLFLGCATVLAICLVVLGWNWRYVYNWLAGPFDFEAQLAADPGPREFVRAEGPLVPTGLNEETTFRILGGLTETTSVSASYFGMIVDGKFLITKVPRELSGSDVEGRLIPMPADVRSHFDGDGAYYPWLLDGDTDYRWDFNLFVMFAGPIFVVGLPMLPALFYRSRSVERHSAIRRLAPYGKRLELIEEIENEAAEAGEASRVGPVWVTPNWVVVLRPSLAIFKLSDVIGVGGRLKPTKHGGPIFQLHFWIRDRLISDQFDLHPSEGAAILKRFREVRPAAVVDSFDVFEKRWTRDRKACAADVDARS